MVLDGGQAGDDFRPYIYIYDYHKISMQSVLWGSRVVVVRGSMKVTLVSHEDVRTLIPISMVGSCKSLSRESEVFD